MYIYIYICVERVQLHIAVDAGRRRKRYKDNMLNLNGQISAAIVLLRH